MSSRVNLLLLAACLSPWDHNGVVEGEEMDLGGWLVRWDACLCVCMYVQKW